MNYPPKHHQETDFQNIIATIQKYPLATLISAKDSEIFTTHLPFLYDADYGKFGRLLAHIDKHNPQLELLQNNTSAQVIFHGPDCYISPNIYSSTQLPTWNYVKVHITGKVTRIEDDTILKNDIASLTSFLETSENPYVLDVNNPKVDALTDYIVGFQLEITSWEGKFKLSQDKLKKDMHLAKDALIAKNKEDITPFIESILKK